MRRTLRVAGAGRANALTVFDAPRCVSSARARGAHRGCGVHRSGRCVARRLRHSRPGLDVGRRHGFTRPGCAVTKAPGCAGVGGSGRRCWGATNRQPGANPWTPDVWHLRVAAGPLGHRWRRDRWRNPSSRPAANAVLGHAAVSGRAPRAPHGPSRQAVMEGQPEPQRMNAPASAHPLRHGHAPHSDMTSIKQLSMRNKRQSLHTPTRP